jgi:hypothetical protein
MSPTLYDPSDRGAGGRLKTTTLNKGHQLSSKEAPKFSFIATSVHKIDVFGSVVNVGYNARTAGASGVVARELGMFGGGLY